MKTKNVLLTVLKRALFIIELVTFWGLMAMDNPQVMRLSRTSVIVMVSYMLAAFVSIYIFGGFDVGKRKLRDITNSLLLSQFMIDFIAYMVLMFMNTNEYSSNVFRFSAKKLMLICVILHILEILLIASRANQLYFKIHAGEKCCVITPVGTNIKNVEKAMHSKNITITDVIEFDEAGEWKTKLKRCDNVVLFGLPLGQREAAMEYAYKYDKNIYFSPNICDVLEVTAQQLMFEDSLMLYSPKHELTMTQRVAKRILDISVSLVMIIISSPIWLICAILIKADDGGRIFFKQDRATLGGKPFKIYKFRTMRDSTETNPMKLGDDRVTKAGNFIRKTRMDELPQLLNILKGEMSLVGPRPEQMKYIHGFDQDYEEYEYRLKVKAGLTGYAQIEGKYNTTNKDKLILDLMYIQNYSIWLDIKLIMQTLLVFFKKDSSEGF